MKLQVLHLKKNPWHNEKAVFWSILATLNISFIFITAIICGNQTLPQSPVEVVLEDPIMLNYLKYVIFSFGGEESEPGLFLVF